MTRHWIPENWMSLPPHSWYQNVCQRSWLSLHLSPWKLNLGPHTYTENALHTEMFFKPLALAFRPIIIIFLLLSNVYSMVKFSVTSAAFKQKQIFHYHHSHPSESYLHKYKLLYVADHH